jgi:hypothetical protein
MKAIVPKQMFPGIMNFAFGFERTSLCSFFGGEGEVFYGSNARESLNRGPLKGDHGPASGDSWMGNRIFRLILGESIGITGFQVLNVALTTQMNHENAVPSS